MATASTNPPPALTSTHRTPGVVGRLTTPLHHHRLPISFAPLGGYMGKKRGNWDRSPYPSLSALIPLLPQILVHRCTIPLCPRSEDVATPSAPVLPSGALRPIHPTVAASRKPCRPNCGMTRPSLEQPQPSPPQHIFTS
ncbi:hypothetical protein GUJ93_ZPchr0015g6619 [Zizania palustris]|uniref:Uncharacterized protein n=1 Tax=Zizania palustris TaxID=103762 RepID=A0A8J5VVG5_ZIZPA|nr:hypothetical protein GUJ93_ZPchr0015g6619 [Zizania palustris]